MKISCNFELEFYDDRLVPIAAKIAKSKAEEDANLICTHSQQTSAPLTTSFQVDSNCTVGSKVVSPHLAASGRINILWLMQPFTLVLGNIQYNNQVAVKDQSGISI